MAEKHVTINRLLRSIATRCRDGEDAVRYEEAGYAEGMIADYIARDVRDLLHVWPADLGSEEVKRIGDRIAAKDKDAFRSVLVDLLPPLEDRVDSYFASKPSGDLSSALVDLLHPTVFQSSYAQFRAGRLRDAVLNAIIAVFDQLRAKTGLDKDGTQLAAEAFSLDRPKLVVSNLNTEAGQNEQKGFIQLLQGAYLGIRNPKAHSLTSDLDVLKAAQYLVFASILARRIEEASLPGQSA